MRTGRPPYRATLKFPEGDQVCCTEGHSTRKGAREHAERIAAEHGYDGVDEAAAEGCARGPGPHSAWQSRCVGYGVRGRREMIRQLADARRSTLSGAPRLELLTEVPAAALKPRTSSSRLTGS